MKNTTKAECNLSRKRRASSKKNQWSDNKIMQHLIIVDVESNTRSQPKGKKTTIRSNGLNNMDQGFSWLQKLH
jgi:hypothetical protein